MSNPDSTPGSLTPEGERKLVDPCDLPAFTPDEVFGGFVHVVNTLPDPTKCWRCGAPRGNHHCI